MPSTQKQWTVAETNGFGKFWDRYTIDFVRHLLTLSQYVSPLLTRIHPSNLRKNSARFNSYFKLLSHFDEIEGTACPDDSGVTDLNFQ
jgi:hypothetical protein